MNRGVITPYDGSNPKNRDAVAVRRSNLRFSKRQIKNPEINIPDENLQSYLESLEKFIVDCDIQAKWEEAKNEKISKGNDFNLNGADENIRYFYEHYILGLCGTRLEGDLLNRLRKICKKSPKHISLIYKSVRKVEKNNPASAKHLYAMINALPFYLKIACRILDYSKKIFAKLAG